MIKFSEYVSLGHPDKTGTWQGKTHQNQTATENNIKAHFVAPKNNRTKIDAVVFEHYCEYEGRTSEHARDAAMLVYKR